MHSRETLTASSSSRCSARARSRTHLEQQILEGAEGNPFYLEELVGTLAETGVLVREDDGWRFDHEAKIVIPPTVEKVILARIDRLSARDRDVLTAASVFGRRFGLPLLEGVTGADGSLQESLNALQRVDLIRRPAAGPSRSTGSSTR